VELHAANGYLLNQFWPRTATCAPTATDLGEGAHPLRGRSGRGSRMPPLVPRATAIRVSPGHMFNDIVDANPLETHVALLDALPTADMAYVH